jgi:hypothetical protein
MGLPLTLWSPKVTLGPKAKLASQRGDHRPAVQQVISLCRELGWDDILDQCPVRARRADVAMAYLIMGRSGG